MPDIPLTLRLVKGDTLTYEEGDTNFTNLRDGINEVSVYTNTTPVPVSIGGIASGTTFTDIPIQTVLDNLLYPYQIPIFGSFYINGQTTPLEVGATSNANPSFIWSTTNPTNIISNSISIIDNTSSSILVSGHSITPPATITASGITKTSATSENYQISATNTQTNIFTKNYSISWQWRIFYGESATTTLVSSDITGLRATGLQGGFAGTYNFNAGAGEYKYLAYPAILGTATSFIDQGTGLSVPFNAPYVVSITNTYGITTNYNVHGTVFMIGSALTVVVS